MILLFQRTGTANNISCAVGVILLEARTKEGFTKAIEYFEMTINSDRDGNDSAFQQIRSGSVGSERRSRWRLPRASPRICQMRVLLRLKHINHRLGGGILISSYGIRATIPTGKKHSSCEEKHAR